MTSLKFKLVALASSLVALVTTPSVRSGIDLTPTVNEYVALGMKHQQLTFAYDTQKIEFEPPNRWKFSGSANQVRLTPPEKLFAEALIVATPLTKPRPLDENAIKLFEQETIAGLPVNSQFAKIEEELANSLLVAGNASVEITLSYQSIGEKFRRTVWLVNLPDTQLYFSLTAKKDDFEALRREFKASILSWHLIDRDSTAKDVAAQ